MTTFEDKLKSFASYLRNRQKEFTPVEIINSLSDDEVLESYRINSQDQTPFYTKEQERGVIMEYETNEAIYGALGDIQEMNHTEVQEKRLIEEYSSDIKEIVLPKTEILTKLLKKLSNEGIKLEYADLNILVKDIASVFPEWILDGLDFVIKELQPQELSMQAEEYCPSCLLEKTLKNYRTLKGWSRFALNGEKDNDSTEPMIYMKQIIDQGEYMFFDLCYDGSDDPESVDDNKIMEIAKAILTIVYNYIFDLPLMSCWIYGKEIAQDRINRNEEEKEFIRSVNEKFKDYDKTSREKSLFFINVESFLKSISYEHLTLLYEYGLPLDLSKKDSKRINRFMENLLETRNEENDTATNKEL